MIQPDNNHHIDLTNPANPTAINELVTALANKSGSARQRARETLVELGRPAVPNLVAVLGSANQQIRWEAAKALSEIADPSSSSALVTTLEDNDPGIRWLAAEGLSKIGQPGLAPLLEALVQRPASSRLRQGAHQVLGRLIKGEWRTHLEPVLLALEGPAPLVAVPQAAQAALETLL